jgi:hypothetical protein
MNKWRKQDNFINKEINKNDIINNLIEYSEIKKDKRKKSKI